MSAFIPSRIANPCATMAHTWLKRRLIFQLEENREVWLNDFDNLPRVLMAIPTKVQEMRLLIAQATEALSPADLIERTPISDLPNETKVIIRNAVHGAYLQLDITQPLITKLQTALDAFDAVSDKIGRCWTKSPNIRRTLLEELGTAANRLREAFLELPSEIVLP